MSIGITQSQVTTPSISNAVITTKNSSIISLLSGDVMVWNGSEWINELLPSGTWNQIQNAAGNLTLANAGYTTEFDQTSAVAWLWKNTTTATSGTTNASPLLEVAANYWTGAASAVDTWTIGSSLAAGTNGISTLAIGHSGSTGNLQIKLPIVDSLLNPTLYCATNKCGISPGPSSGYASHILLDASGVFLDFAINGTRTAQFSGLSADDSLSWTNNATGPFYYGSQFPTGATFGMFNFGVSSTAFTGPASGTFVIFNVGGTGTTGSSSPPQIDWAPTASGSASLIAAQIAPTVNNTSPGPAISSAVISSATSAAVTIPSTTGFVTGASVTIANVTTTGFTGLNGTWVVASATSTVLTLTTTGLTAKSQATCNGNVNLGAWNPLFGGYTALKIAATETAVIAGANNYLINCLAGSAGTTSEFYVDNKGNVVSAGTVTPTGGLTNSYSVALTGQTGTINATNLVATPVTTALYEISYYLNDTTAGTSGTVSVTITWNDGGSQTFTSSNVTFGTAGAFVSGIIIVKATSGAIQYATTVTSAIGSPAYSLDLRVKQLV